MKPYETVIVQLTSDDLFELKRLRERAEKESQNCKFVPGEYTRGGAGCQIYTEVSREAMHAAETLNRILKQAELSPINS